MVINKPLTGNMRFHFTLIRTKSKDVFLVYQRFTNILFSKPDQIRDYLLSPVCLTFVQQAKTIANAAMECWGEHTKIPE